MASVKVFGSPASMPNVKVFGSPASTEVQRVLTCLFEKKVDFKLVRIDNFRGSMRQPEFLKLQPGGEALAYQDDEHTLVESRAICRHVVDKFKNQGNTELLGNGALERSAIEQWLETEANKFDPPSSVLVFYLKINSTLLQPEPDDPAAVAESKKKLEKVIKVYDQQLKDNKFLTGNKFTLADLSHLPNTELLMKNDDMKKMFESYKNVSRWWSEISQKESWQNVLKIAMLPPPMA